MVVVKLCTGNLMILALYVILWGGIVGLNVKGRIRLGGLFERFEFTG